jgi:hypothetical protein
LLKILVQKAGVGVNFERCLIYLLEEEYLRCVAWIDRVKTERNGDDAVVETNRGKVKMKSLMCSIRKA